MPQGPVAAAADHPHFGCPASSLNREHPKGRSPQAQRIRSRNYSWAELMRRVWALDVLECPRCFGRMKIVAAIHSSEAIRKILDCLGLPARAPPIAGPSPDGDIDDQVIFSTGDNPDSSLKAEVCENSLLIGIRRCKIAVGGAVRRSEEVAEGPEVDTSSRKLGAPS